MRTQNAAATSDVTRSYPNVTHEYREIGISAVAAAVRYQQDDEQHESKRAPFYPEQSD